MGLSEKRYRVSHRNVKHPRLELRTGELLVVLPLGYEPGIILEKHQGWVRKKVDFIEECLKDSSQKALVDRSEENFRELVGRCAEEAEKDLGVKVNRLFFRKMKTKWASCSPKRNLTVNTLMKHLPDQLIKYIVFHEITHIKEKKHNDTFWRIISGEFDEHRELEKELFSYWFLTQARKVLF